MPVSTQIIPSDRDFKGRHQSISSTVVILVGGLPGTGKTYFASRLSAKLGASYINSDLTRKQMDAQGRYAFEDKLNVYEEMAKRAGKELRRNKSVVVDATFYCREMRQMFHTLATLMHFKLVFIEIIADEKVVLKRFRAMEARPEVNLSVHKLVKTKYQRPEIDHLVLESKDDNIEEMLETAADYISKCSGEL